MSLSSRPSSTDINYIRLLEPNPVANLEIAYTDGSLLSLNQLAFDRWIREGYPRWAENGSHVCIVDLAEKTAQ